MTPTTLIRSFAAACAAAVFLPAQEVEEIVIQDPKPSTHAVKVDRGARDLKKQLAEIVSTLEDDDSSSADRAKAKKKLLEIVAKLSKDEDATAPGGSRAVIDDGRIVVRRRAGAGSPFDAELEGVAVEVADKAKAKAEVDLLRRRVAKLDRTQERELAELKAAVGKVRKDNGDRAAVLRERADALRAMVAEANPEAREVRGRVLRALESVEESQQGQGSGDENVERFTKLLRAAMERRRAEVAEHELHVEHEQHAEQADRQLEQARRALEQARKQLQKVQAEFEAAHGGHAKASGFRVAPRLRKTGDGEDGAFLLELDTKLDRILPPKGGKTKRDNNVFYFSESPGDAKVEGHGGTWVGKAEQGKGDEKVALRWLENHAKSNTAKVGKSKGGEDAVRWTVVAPEEAGEPGEENVYHIEVQAEAPKDAAKRGNVFYLDSRAEAPKADAKDEDVRAFFGGLARKSAAAGDDDDDGDIREMIEALRKEMRELRKVLREVKAHIGAAAPVDLRFPAPSALQAPSAPPAPAAHPGALHVAPGEVRSARFLPGLRTVPARLRVPRPVKPSGAAPQQAPPLPPAPPLRAAAPTGLGGIK